MKPGRLLDRFLIARTGSLDETQAALTRVYAVAPALKLMNVEGAFLATINHCQLQHIGLSYPSYTGSLRMAFPET